MRYAVISDIHGNLEAFQAVLADIKDKKIGAYLCIGDVVGYGANPKESIGLLKSLKCSLTIAGNHDWAVAGLTDLEYFNEYAKEAIIWTKRVLNQEELDYLKSFHLLYEGENFSLVHGSLKNPQRFDYILNKAGACSAIALMRTLLCFVGHSHVAEIYYSDKDKIFHTRGPNIKIGSNKKYIVNVGSIGQPRDGDPRASYAIYDEDGQTVEIKRVPYDVKAAKEKIIDAGLPGILAARLSEGR